MSEKPAAPVVRPIRGRSCVDVLREALEMAERGELVAVCVVHQTRETKDKTSEVSWAIGYAAGHWKSAVIGGLETAKLDILLELRGAQ